MFFNEDSLSFTDTDNYDSLNNEILEEHQHFEAQKDEIKIWHDFAIKLYFVKLQNVKLRTMKSYHKIIRDFIDYSPDLNPEDLEDFMEFKFKVSKTNVEFKTPYSGTQNKYASTIKRFLESVFTIDPIKVKMKHYKLKNKHQKDRPPIISHKDVLRAYEELSLLFQFQDAVIIHTMYALALDPYTICLLTFEGIINHNVIQYWDHKTSKLKSKSISIELLNDLNYFKSYSIKKEDQSNDTFRTAPDGEIVKGTFIFNISPTNIYSRFKRKFGNKLSWFNPTPLNIIQLSKYRVKLTQKDFIPTLKSKLG